MLVQASIQLNVDHSMYSAFQRANAKARLNGSGTLLLILSSYNDEQILLSSGYFVPDRSTLANSTYAGRTFKFGRFNGIDTVYAISGQPLASVSVTVQIMLENVTPIAVIVIGGGRSIDYRVNVGDVVMPYSSAYSGVWLWEEYEGSNGLSETPNTTLRIGDYNLPEAGENTLGSIKFQPVTDYSRGIPESAERTTFWFDLSDDFKQKSYELMGVELQKCLDGTSVCNNEARLHLGLRSASSDIYLKNDAYGTFLNRELGASVIDKETAAISSTCKANGKKFAAFRAITNKAGVKTDKSMNTLATINSFRLAAIFANLISGNSIKYRYVEA